MLLRLVLKARRLLIAISETAVCQGNFNERFLTLPNIYENKIRDARGIFKYYILCHAKCFLLEICIAMCKGYITLYFFRNWCGGSGGFQ